MKTLAKCLLPLLLTACDIEESDDHDEWNPQPPGGRGYESQEDKRDWGGSRDDIFQPQRPWIQPGGNNRLR